jgi:quercetin dioxygenase-like cupin family protein
MSNRATHTIAGFLALYLAFGSHHLARAHPDEIDVAPNWQGTLEELFALFAPSKASAAEFKGPTKPKGISAKSLGEADLTGELPGLENRNLRARLWTMEPGGIVPVHSHVDRPAYVYVLEGEVTEHRSDDDKPHVFGAGALSVEAGGVVHWWENTGGTTVKLIAVDLFHKK